MSSGRRRRIRWRVGVLAALAGAALLLVAVRKPLLAVAYEALATLQSEFETRYARAALAPEATFDAIIVLGGNWSRISAAVDLAVRFTKTRLVVSGAAPRELELLTHAEIDPAHLVLERKKTTTLPPSPTWALTGPIRL